MDNFKPDKPSLKAAKGLGAARAKNVRGQTVSKLREDGQDEHEAVIKKNETHAEAAQVGAQLGAQVGKQVVAHLAPIETYADAQAYLESLTNVEAMKPSRVDQRAVFTLERMRALVGALENPERTFRTLHVAGSKGKGSVCEMTAAALAGCGVTAGVYTSPHLVDIRERIRIGARWISEEAFARCLARVQTAANSLDISLGNVTHFEALTAAAFVHFADEAVDFAVIEVGMGGLLDATNVITPTVTAITAIQLEHTQILGTTLKEIAVHKAGIMKAGVPCITMGQDKGVMEVFRATAERVGCSLRVLGAELEFSFRFGKSDEHGGCWRVSVTSPRRAFEHMVVPLKGEPQAHNLGIALGIVDALAERGVSTPEGGVALGLTTTQSSGRMEFVHSSPRIVVDGAHNPESIGELVKTLGAHVKYDSLVVVFGCAADKDVTGMLAKIATGADKIIFTRAEGSARAIDPKELMRKFGEVSTKMAQVALTVKDALNLAARAVTRGDLICVTGSFAIAGEAKRALMAKAAGQKTEPKIALQVRSGLTGNVANAAMIDLKPGEAKRSGA